MDSTNSGENLIVIKNKVGFFCERTENEAKAEILAHRCEQRLPDHERIVRYLGTGHALFIAPTIVFDCASEEETEIGPLKILTDGTYAWTSDLAYYVKRYNYPLPVQFVEHMRGNLWRCPEIPDLSRDRVAGMV